MTFFERAWGAIARKAPVTLKSKATQSTVRAGPAMAAPSKDAATSRNPARTTRLPGKADSHDAKGFHSSLTKTGWIVTEGRDRISAQKSEGCKNRRV